MTLVGLAISPFGGQSPRPAANITASWRWATQGRSAGQDLVRLFASVGRTISVPDLGKIADAGHLKERGGSPGRSSVVHFPAAGHGLNGGAGVSRGWRIAATRPGVRCPPPRSQKLASERRGGMT
jgi:hypothetical protein